MANKKFTKRALLSSVIALFICFAMLVGTTYAWFTDSVTSEGNIIQTGKLEIAMSWANGTEDPASATWTDASAGPIFEYDKWEPGYVDVKHVSIENKGTLGLKYMVKIVANGPVSDLAEVIDVYYMDPAAAVTDRAALTDENKLGTLADVLAGVETSAAGELLNNGDKHTITIALKMQEEAGNEYQDMSIGTTFSVVVFATQLAAEEDAFGPEYDEDAPYVEVTTAEELQAVLNAGGYAKLANDITATDGKRFDIPEGGFATIDLNGYTLTSKDGGSPNWMAIYVNKGAYFTLEDSVGTGKLVSSCYGVYVQPGATFVMNGGTLEVKGNGQYDMAVCLYNGAFIMNEGTIDAKYAVWSDNYWKNNGQTEAPISSITIKDGCTVITTAYAAINIYDAPDTVVNVPASVTVYK